MSNSELNKLGPFFHKGGLIATNSPIWNSGGFAGKVKIEALDLPSGWYYRVAGPHDGVVVLYGARGFLGANYPTEKLAKRAYERASKRRKWIKLWRAAINNIPDFERETEVVKWVAQPKGSISLPDYVYAAAHGTMTAESGIIYKREIQIKMIKAAKQATLARLLGYTFIDKKTGKLRVNSMSFSNVIGNGIKPRDPEKQKLVLRLASGEGKALAKKLVRKAGLDTSTP